MEPNKDVYVFNPPTPGWGEIYPCFAKTLPREESKGDEEIRTPCKFAQLPASQSHVASKAEKNFSGGRTASRASGATSSRAFSRSLNPCGVTPPSHSSTSAVPQAAAPTTLAPSSRHPRVPAWAARITSERSVRSGARDRFSLDSHQGHPRS